MTNYSRVRVGPFQLEPRTRGMKLFLSGIQRRAAPFEYLGFPAATRFSIRAGAWSDQTQTSGQVSILSSCPRDESTYFSFDASSAFSDRRRVLRKPLLPVIGSTPGTHRADVHLTTDFEKHAKSRAPEIHHRKQSTLSKRALGMLQC